MSWVASFLENYRRYLAPDHRDSNYGLCLARLEYSKGNFSKALDLLPQTEYKDLFLTLASKALQIKIYYAMQAHDLLYAHLQAMRAFIRRKKRPRLSSRKLSECHLPDA